MVTAQKNSLFYFINEIFQMGSAWKYLRNFGKFLILCTKWQVTIYFSTLQHFSGFCNSKTSWLADRSQFYELCSFPYLKQEKSWKLLLWHWNFILFFFNFFHCLYYPPQTASVVAKGLALYFHLHNKNTFIESDNAILWVQEKNLKPDENIPTI